MSHNTRLAALERAVRVSQQGHVVVIKGGMPNSDPTATEIAEAVSRSNAERGQIVVVGGLPEGPHLASISSVLVGNSRS